MMDTLTRAFGKTSTFNEEARTVEVVWSTGAPVKRRSWDEGEYMEELSMEPKAIRMDRFASMSLLDSHDNWSMAARLGTVVPNSVRIQKGKGVATVKLSRTDAGEAIFRDLQDGHPINISVGYKVHRYEKTDGDGTRLPTFRAIDWEPMELSVVPIPADAGSHSRSESSTGKPNMEVSKEESPTPTRKERTRIKEIQGLARSAGLKMDDELVTRSIDEGATLDQFRSAMLNKLIEKEQESPTFSHSPTRFVNEELNDPSFFRKAAVDAFLARIHNKPAEGPAAQIFAEGEIAFGKRCLENAGINCFGWSDERVKRSYLTTSDFSLIAGSVANVRLVETYKENVSQLGVVFGRRVVDDFNQHTEAFVDWTTLKIERVNEVGEYKNSYVDESGETISVFTMGGIFAMSRHLAINAFDALNDFGKMQGKALASNINVRMSEHIQQNAFAGPKMRDNLPVFHSNRENIEQLDVSAPAATGDALMLLRSKMARRKGKGDVIIGVYPKYWVVHPDFEGYAIKTLASIQASAVADVNPIAGRLTIVSDPRFTDPTKSWLVADPSAMDGTVRVYLAGNEEPYTETRQGFRVDGVEFKIRQDFGLGWLEWRSWTRLDHFTPTPEEG